MSKRPIRDKIKGGRDDDISPLKNAAIKAIKGMVLAIKRNFEVTMVITSKIVGMGTVSTFEFLKSEIEQENEEETESTRKIAEVLKARIEKAKERIIKLLEAKNLTNLTFSVGTETIPYLSSITDINIEITISLVA